MENVVVVEAEQITLIEVSNDDVVVVETGQQGLPGRDGLLPILVTQTSSLVNGRFAINGEPLGGLIHDMAIITNEDGISYEVTGVSIMQEIAGYFGVLPENDRVLLEDYGVVNATATFSYLSLGA